MNLKKFITYLIIILFPFFSFADEKIFKGQNAELSIYTGMFDFSDDGKK